MRSLTSCGVPAYLVINTTCYRTLIDRHSLICIDSQHLVTHYSRSLSCPFKLPLSGDQDPSPAAELTSLDRRAKALKGRSNWPCKTNHSVVINYVKCKAQTVQCLVSFVVILSHLVSFWCRDDIGIFGLATACAIPMQDSWQPFSSASLSLESRVCFKFRLIISFLWLSNMLVVVGIAILYPQLPGW